MRLYYFTTERFGLEAIRDSRLKLARINDLNDPFEFMGLNLNRGNRRTLVKLKKDMSDRFGIICMSRVWSHPLLWGHYAEKHRGLCLGFDVAEEICEEVKYRTERPTLKDLDYDTLGDLDETAMFDVVYTKFDAWEYETEYRIYCRLKDKDPVNDLYFVSFSEDLKLAHVIVGERCSVTRDRLASVLGERAGTVTSFKARAGFKRFEVVENKLKNAWR
jgi:hypothetical protein